MKAVDRYPNFDLDLYLKEQNVFYRKHDSDDHIEYALNCPKCKERGEMRNDTKRRLWVNPKKGTFYCYNCGWDGPLARLVQIFSRCDWQRAIRILNGRKLDSLDLFNFNQLTHGPRYTGKEGFEDSSDSLKEIEYPHGFVPFSEIDYNTIFHDYLVKRDIPLDIAKDHGWGFSEVGYTANRLIVPTYMEKKLVFWQARDILGDDHPYWGTKDYKKVLNPKGVSAKHVLYNYDTAKNHGEIILCEGFIDAIKAGPNAVATNGKTLHPAQVEWLTKTKAKNIVILWDNDAYTDEKRYLKGRRKGRIRRKSSVDQASDLLKIQFNVRCVKLPEGRDAGSYKMGELEDIIMSEWT